ncbi:hypothetical protein MMC13_007721 [Lambiella insularis]|nr:hypothetical protein [Lambiella insularis]
MGTSRLLSLPGELRVMIYAKLFNLCYTAEPNKDSSVFNVLLVNHQIRKEVFRVLGRMKFIKIRLDTTSIPLRMFDQVPKLPVVPFLTPALTIEMARGFSDLSHRALSNSRGNSFMTTTAGLADFVSCLWMLLLTPDQFYQDTDVCITLEPDNIEVQRKILSYLHPVVPPFRQWKVFGNSKCHHQLSLAQQFRDIRAQKLPRFSHMIPQIMEFWISQGNASRGKALYDLAISEYKKALAFYDGLSNHDSLPVFCNAASKLFRKQSVISLSIRIVILLAGACIHAGKAVEARAAAQEALLKSDLMRPSCIAICKIYVARSWFLDGNIRQGKTVLAEAAAVIKMHDGATTEELQRFVDFMRSVQSGFCSRWWRLLTVDASQRFPKMRAKELKDRMKAFAELPMAESYRHETGGLHLKSYS